ncbi:DUF1523 family protein [Vogesella indigofera]|uniref:DUF1523 family protein n=1 Tax=Vogesella indigofera TaxID=45465 RepID=UPI00234F891F|nr:DUF1523 family protein [Vogesella indigofera]MDC7712299.1 DUF1523 family protein [Vogesella indigofera]
MRHKLRNFALALLALVALLGSALLDYYLPEHSITTITGVEVKLADKDGPISRQNPADQPVRDMYLIYTQHAIDDVRVYRNEDTGWGWPFYFKFDASDVQATANAIANARQPAYLTSYGWRINMLSLYPNVTAIRLAEAGEATWSFFRWFWFALWFALLAAAGWGLLRVTRHQPDTTNKEMT